MEEENLTDHRYIYYELKGNAVPKKMTEKQKSITDWNAYNANVKIRLCKLEREERSSHKICTDIIREAYRNSTIKGPVGIKTVPYWWNASINDKRKECMEARRRYTRIAKLNTREDEKLKANEKYKAKKKELAKLIRLSKKEHWNKLEKYKAKKKELAKLIRLSKKEHWNKLCNDLNGDIWGEGYKIAVKGLKNFVPYDLPDKNKREIARRLFPCSSSGRQDYRTTTGRILAELKFTATELTEALNKMKTGKAPGLDGIPIEAIKETERANS
ncbi:hypothetical protein QE152_g17091 [Popillia japonica]|uniref:Endonuclease-reverse transcriptase n=1 Tax=Popillia japonica TaxID=7064 RepID=A0AAW1L571_POPJA